MVNSLVLAIITKSQGEAAAFPFLFGQTSSAQESLDRADYAVAPLSLTPSRPQYSDRKGSDSTGKEAAEAA